MLLTLFNSGQRLKISSTTKSVLSWRSSIVMSTIGIWRLFIVSLIFASSNWTSLKRVVLGLTPSYSKIFSTGLIIKTRQFSSRRLKIHYYKKAYNRSFKPAQILIGWSKKKRHFSSRNWWKTIRSMDFIGLLGTWQGHFSLLLKISAL